MILIWSSTGEYNITAVCASVGLSLSPTDWKFGIEGVSEAVNELTNVNESNLFAYFCSSCDKSCEFLT